MTDDLKTYISRQLDAGKNADSIKDILIKYGWQPVLVDEAFEALNTVNTKTEVDNKMAKTSSKAYSGFWIRLLASILDSFIIGIPAAIVSFVIVFATGIDSIYYLINFAVAAFIIYLDGIHGGTPGKLILGMRIVNEKGEYIGIPLAILRYIGKSLSGVILGIGYLMIAFDSKKQGLHDKIASTYVVKV